MTSFPSSKSSDVSADAEIHLATDSHFFMLFRGIFFPSFFIFFSFSCFSIFSCLPLRGAPAVPEEKEKLVLPLPPLRLQD